MKSDAVKSKAAKRVTLSGYYGFGNAGDEAVLAGLAAGFRAVCPAGELELIALSGHPAETRTTHGISAAERMKPGPLIAAIARTDLFLSGGGSLLQDVTSAHSIFYYLGVVRMAQLLGKKTMFAAQGIGPLTLPRSRRLVASVANRLDAITVRDGDSAKLLREIGVSRPMIEVTADPALLLTPIETVRGSSSFGVALRAWPGQELLANQVAEACSQTLGESRPLLFPMMPQNDLGPAEQFAAKWHQVTQQASKAVVCSAQEGLPSLLVNIHSCEMMVGMRLHALILAAACGVPSVALAYDPKVAAFMASCGQADAVYDLSRPDPNALTTLISRFWSERSTRAEALQAVLPSLRTLAARNIGAALELLSLA